jgi:acylphosphatase
MSNTAGKHIHITGIVQGVGFRPFVYGLAIKHDLTGWVRNTSAGVDIEVNGPESVLEAFVEGLRTEAPPLSQIDTLDVAERPFTDTPSFKIVHSEAVADAFVRKTRFDPMHSAETEQQIYDGIESLVSKLGTEMAVEVTIEKDGEARTAEVRRDALLAATAERYKRLVESLETQRDGAALALAVDQSLAALPGLTDLLGAMPDTELQIVSPENVRHTIVDTRQSWVTSDNSQLRLVQDIPWSADAAATPVASVSAGSGEVPTHVLFDGVAHPVGRSPMVIGLEPGTAPGPRLERRYPGVSRQHFRVQRKEKELWIEDLSRYGTFVNGEKVAGTRQLRVGDEIRIGNPAAAFQVIRVASDGA